MRRRNSRTVVVVVEGITIQMSWGLVGVVWLVFSVGGKMKQKLRKSEMPQLRSRRNFICEITTNGYDVICVNVFHLKLIFKKGPWLASSLCLKSPGREEEGYSRFQVTVMITWNPNGGHKSKSKQIYRASNTLYYRQLMFLFLTFDI